MPVRTLSEQIYIGFNNLAGGGVPPMSLVQAVRRNSIDVGQAFGQPISGGSVTVAITPPAEPQLKDPVAILLGVNGVLTQVFQGFVTGITQHSYPQNIWTLTVQDINWIAEFVTKEEMNFGNNVTANDVIEQLFVNEASIDVSRLALPQLESATGVPWVMGRKGPVKFSNTNPLSAAQKICEVLGYWLYADSGGIIRAVQMIGEPAATPVQTYIEGADFLVTGAPQRTGNIEQIYNEVTVTGGQTGVEGATVTDTWRVEHPLLPTQKYRRMTYSNELIEDTSRAEGGEASAEAVAQRLLRYHSRTPFVVRATIVGESARAVGQTVAVISPRLKLDTARNFFIHSINRRRSAARDRMDVVLDGGAGPDGFSLNPEPTAVFSYSLVAFTLEAGPAVAVFLNGKGSISYSGGEIAEWTWTDGTTTRGPNEHPRSVYIFDPSATPTITLTVRDTNNKTGSVSVTLDLSGTSTGAPKRYGVSFANGNSWMVSPDHGDTWRTLSGTPTLATPPIGPNVGTDGVIAGAGPNLRRTSDYLLSDPQVYGGLPQNPVWLWQNETTPGRVVAASGDGVYISASIGSIFQSTTKPAAGTDVNVVVESADESAIDALAGGDVYTSTDEGETWTQTLSFPSGTLRAYTSGHGKHWVGAIGVSGGAQPVRSVEGDTSTLPGDVTSVRALTNLVDENLLVVFSEDGRIFTLNGEDGGTSTLVGNLGDTPQHAIRAPDRFVYVAANGGLYVFFPDSGEVRLFKAAGVGNQGHMVGYVSTPTT